MLVVLYGQLKLYLKAEVQR